MNRPAIHRAHFRACVIGALAIFSFAELAAAQQPTPEQAAAIRQSCRSDFQAHCKGVPTGGDEALECLKRNAGASSAACQGALAALGGGAGSTPAAANSGAAPSAGQAPSPTERRLNPRDEARILRNNCQADYRAHCAGTPLGEGRAIACLKANASALSAGCQSALTAAMQ